MANIRRLLCPLDLSERSTTIARSSAELASQVGGELILLHVLDDASLHVIELSGQSYPTIQEDLSREAARKLKLIADQLATESCSIGVRVEVGVAAEVIMRRAEELGVDLIVLGRPASPLVRRILAGSVGDRVIRTSSVPVLCLPA